VTDPAVWKLKTEGFPIAIDIILKKGGKKHMNTILFHEYISTVPLPHMTRV
jgi:hypothetical protein